MFTNDNLNLLAEKFSTLNYEKLQNFFPQVDKQVALLSSITGYNYKNKKIAAIALVHRSALVFWPNNKNGIISNERFEFLGDAFLNFYIATASMILQPQLHEGELSKLRAIIVGTKNLAKKSKELNFDSCLLMGTAELNAGVNQQNNTLADAFEAITASLLLDAGQDFTIQWLNKIFAADLQIHPHELSAFDCKGTVQHWTQSILGIPPTYKTIYVNDLTKDIIFTVGAFIGTHELARADGRNKREASIRVAEQILQLIKEQRLTKEDLLLYGKKS